MPPRARADARLLEGILRGAEDALLTMGRGFLTHPENRDLRQSLANGTVSAGCYLRQLQWLIYRLLLLLTTYDRGMLTCPSAAPETRAGRRVLEVVRHLRPLLPCPPSSPSSRGLYQDLLALATPTAEASAPRLPWPLQGRLMAPERIPDLASSHLADGDLLAAVHALACHTPPQGEERPVDFESLGSQFLGSLHESLMELHAVVDVDPPHFALHTKDDHRRKHSGSYYTPPDLVDCVLESALEPALDEATRGSEPDVALLRLRVCDPACGSGHFLVAAARRIAGRLARVRCAGTPSPDDLQGALREVVTHCLYGADLDAMAVELCKATLLLEARDPTLPAEALEHHFVRGNSLLGATPALLAEGIPDQAFAVREGDLSTHAQALKRQNRVERSLLHARLLAPTAPAADQARDRRLADAWCAAFTWQKHPGALQAITNGTLARLRAGRPHSCAEVGAEVARQAIQHEFLHWHLAFPDVFVVPPQGTPAENAASGWNGGFDVVLGNPPYLRDSRKKELPSHLLALYRAATSHYDLYVLFMELGFRLARPGGWVSFLTSNGFLRQKYGAGVRQLLLERELTWLVEVDYLAFTAGVKTCITTARNRPPAANHQVNVATVTSEVDLQRLHAHDRTSIGHLSQDALASQRTFSLPRVRSAGDTSRILVVTHTIPLHQLAFVSLGMVFHDPRPGGLKKRDYLSAAPDARFSTPLVDGEHVAPWRTTGRLWLDYRPQEHREPRFRPLFHSPKVLCRRILGKSRLMACVDAEGLFFSDNVVGVVPYHLLEGCPARTLSFMTPEHIERSRAFDPHYLVALLNSAPFTRLCREELGMGVHFYPAHAKGLPIRVLPLVEQQALATLSREAHALAAAEPASGEAQTRLEEVQATIDRQVASLYDTSL